MKTIGDIGGEFALIARIARDVNFRADDGVVVGIGDDAAVLRVDAGEIVITTDMLIEDVHFRLTYGDPYSLGVKCAAVNLSDIAAMGAKPIAAFVSLALPSTIDLSFVDELYRGMNAACAESNCEIAGGDTNMSPGPITINVAVLGTVDKGAAVLRSTARVGDAVFVSGKLGAANVGFQLLERFGRAGAEAISVEAVEAQLRPIPRFTDALLLKASGFVTAMMDLSDGLIGDLEKLCRASGVAARVERDAVPVADSARVAADALGADPVECALRGGEDYLLLFTAPHEHAEVIAGMLRMATGTDATEVGEIVAGPIGTVTVYDASNRTVIAPGGWDHFAA